MRKARSKTSVAPLKAAVSIKTFRRRPPASAVSASIAINACLPTVGDSHAPSPAALCTTPACLAQIGVLPCRRAGLCPWACKARKARSSAGTSAGHKYGFVGPEPRGREQWAGLRVVLNELIPEFVCVDPWNFCAVNATPPSELFETKEDVFCIVSTFLLKPWLEWDTSLPRVSLGVEQKDKVCELHSGRVLR